MIPVPDRSKSDELCLRLNTIPAVNGQTDRRTELVEQYRALNAMNADAR